MPRDLRLAGWWLWGALLCAGVARAEEAGSPAAGITLSSAALTCDYMEFRSSQNVVYARGNAVLITSGTRLEADEITLYLSSRTANAVGNVYLEDSGAVLLSNGVTYSWGVSTGTLSNVFLQEGIWRIWGRKIDRLSEDTYRIERAAFTSCELDPPHYHFRARRAKYRAKKRISVTNARVAVGNDPVLYWPFYTRSLKDNRYTITVDPGNSQRNGYFARTVFGYPFENGTRLRVMWDYYSKAGNGGGVEYSYMQPRVRGSILAYGIEDRVEQTERWNIRLGHWQQLARRWSLQSNVAIQSDENVNDQFVRDDYERVRQLGESDAAVTYAGQVLTSRVFIQHDRVFDPVQNRFVHQRSTLPQLEALTSPLRLFRTNLFLSLSGSVRNEYIRPSTGTNPNPIFPDKDHYQQVADGTANLRWRLPISKSISLEPSVGVTEEWNSHREEPTRLDPKDITQGRGFTGLNWRHRLTRAIDYDFSHRYRVRWRPNTFQRDHAAADQGTEQNDLSFFGSYRPSLRLWARLFTAYDLRDNLGYVTPRQRVSPPTAEFSYAPKPWLRVFAREAVQLYPARKPQSTLATLRVGATEEKYWSTGISYNVSRPGQVDFVQGAAFYLTRGWWLSGDVHMTGTGPGRTNYDTVRFDEKNLVIKRDLHCWVLRITYRERPGVNEVYFRLDLKANAEARRRQQNPDDKQFHPARDGREEY